MVTGYQLSKGRHGPEPSPTLRDLFGDGLCLTRRAMEPADLTQMNFIYQTAETPADDSALAVAWCHTTRFRPGSEPFWYAQAEQVLEPEHAAGLLEWLETITDWKVNDGGFYTAEETALEAEGCPAPLTGIFSRDGLSQLAVSASALFGVDVELHGPIVVHKMTQGHGVGIHSDRPYPGEETHRLLVFLGHDAELCRGGHFILFAGSRPEDARVVLPHRHNAGLAFRLNGDSYHAVSVKRSGVRYSLIISFRER